MKTKLFLSLILLISLSYPENIDISKITTYKYLSLNKTESQFVYLIDYNQENSLLTKFIKEYLLNINNINIRYIPLQTGNTNLCFKLNNTTHISTIKSGEKCQEIVQYRYLNESELPIAIFSDGAVVKKAFNLNGILINDYFNLINKEKKESEEIQIANQKKEELLKTKRIEEQLMRYLKEKEKQETFKKYYNSKYYYSYYCFGKPKLIIIKQIKPTMLKKESQLTIIKNNLLDKQSNIFVFHNNFKLTNNSNILIQEKTLLKSKSLIKLKNIKRTTEVLNNGNTIYHNQPPIKKQLNINWGKLGTPTAINYVPSFTDDPDIKIKTN